MTCLTSLEAAVGRGNSGLHVLPCTNSSDSADVMAAYATIYIYAHYLSIMANNLKKTLNETNKNFVDVSLQC
jgi:hypothetical protein